MLLATSAIIAAILLVSIGLTAVEFRRHTPDIFRCSQCGTEFARRTKPRRCPHCRSETWMP